MTKLNQIVAIERDVKANSYKDLTKEHHLLQKADLTVGMSRTYTPKDDDGEKFPPESKRVQTRVQDALAELPNQLRELWDLTLTKDAGNQLASADVEIDGTALVSGVPVPTLLFLEKQLQDLHTFLAKLPTLDPSEDWAWDAVQGLFVTPPVTTIKTKRIKRPIVAYPATEQHPAQTAIVDEDVVAGSWTTIKQSGAISEDTRRGLVRRCEALTKAVKEARERANMQEVTVRKMSDSLLNYVLGQNNAQR